MLTNLLGSFIPFPTMPSPTDPRAPVSKRYADVKEYCGRLDKACERMVNGRYLLAEDRPRYADYGTRIWEFVIEKKR